MTSDSDSRQVPKIHSSDGVAERWIDTRSTDLLRSEIGPAQFSLALREFAGELCRQSSELSGLRKGRDSERVRRTAHRLKGSAGYFGAFALQYVAGDLEMTAANGDWRATKPVLDRFQRVIDATLASLDKTGSGKE